MALRIVDDKCLRKDGKLHICIEGKNPEEVISQQAKQMAMDKAATCGYVHTGYNGHSGAYPIDKDGVEYDTDEKIGELTQKLRDGTVTISGYRNLIMLMSRA